MKKNNFIFYTEWKNQLELLTDQELRRFNYNLINYHEERPIELITTADKLVWNGVLPGLKSNQKIWLRKTLLIER